jgi:hypothetical protein
MDYIQVPRHLQTFHFIPDEMGGECSVHGNFGWKAWREEATPKT